MIPRVLLIMQPLMAESLSFVVVLLGRPAQALTSSWATPCVVVVPFWRPVVADSALRPGTTQPVRSGPSRAPTAPPARRHRCGAGFDG